MINKKNEKRMVAGVFTDWATYKKIRVLVMNFTSAKVRVFAVSGWT